MDRGLHQLSRIFLVPVLENVLVSDTNQCNYTINVNKPLRNLISCSKLSGGKYQKKSCLSSSVDATLTLLVSVTVV